MTRGSTHHRRDLLRLGALGTFGMTMGCGGSPTLRQNYEFEVEFLVNGSRLSASVVQGIRYRQRKGGIVNPGDIVREPQGEGAALSVPGTSGAIATTFAVLGQAGQSERDTFGGRLLVGHSWTPIDALSRELLNPVPSGYIERIEAVMSLKPPSRWIALMPEDLPVIVHFSDAADPTKATWIDPYDGSAGLRVLSAKIRLSDRDVTRGDLAAILPWLPELGDGLSLARPGQGTEVSWELSPSDFERR